MRAQEGGVQLCPPHPSSALGNHLANEQFLKRKGAIWDAQIYIKMPRFEPWFCRFQPLAVVEAEGDGSGG